ncbi:MAG: translation initiation factor IF-3 [Candidatus Fischerbacteria bacterium RBG_13_37_8]|uniref:Translation initiation factor IF-3 n=1 Tax=Candidatus Fischerbacteria bacterium RBG_13_37_8 TaxID=1817863 RepID=A0A1F5VQ73_9BACT|nr:MAG: translation initiation factor IF-3 [Candidatus Fischerbacteria bacterium RBG_13_37_8]
MQKNLRTNERIRAKEVRLIDDEGKQIGIINKFQALQMAREKELDLVEVAPQLNPPVCKIMDYGKWLYQQNKKMQQAKKKHKTIQIKEIKFRPRISEHDYQFKKRHIEDFLKDGHKVKVMVLFKGRERAYSELGRKIVDRLIEELADNVTVETSPKFEGSSISAVLSPKKSTPEKQQAEAK